MRYITQKKKEIFWENVSKVYCKNCSKEIIRGRKFCSLRCAGKYNSSQRKSRFNDREKLYEMYIRQELSISQIAKRYSCGKTVIHKWLHKLNIPVRRRKEAIQKRKYRKTKEHIAKHRKSLVVNGKVSKNKNPNWNNGISYEPYSADFDEKLKERIRKRDNYTCQYCKKSESELKGYHKKNTIHHVDYDKTNCREDNLITLCRKCNSLANFKRTDWQKIFKSMLKKRR